MTAPTAIVIVAMWCLSMPIAACLQLMLGG